MTTITVINGVKWLVKDGVKIQNLGSISPTVALKNLQATRNEYDGKNIVNTVNYQNFNGTGKIDVIFTYGDGSYVSAAGGDDIIANYGNYASLNGGSGNDYIYTGSSTQGVTLQGGFSNDTLTGSSYGDLYYFGNYDGNDVITNYGTNDTIYFKSEGTGLTARQIKSSISGSDRIIYLDKLGGTRVTLQGAAYKNVTVQYGYSKSTVISSNSTPDPDPEPTPTPVNNYSTSYNSQYLTASSGDDSIYNNYINVKISAGAGNDTINNGTLGDYSSLSGGAGNDSINAGYTYGVTLNGGSGNDTLTGSTSSYSGDVFQFGNYDGNDVITNYGTNDTIHLTGIYSASNITSSISGSNKIISAGSTKITLQGAANKNVQVKLANGSMTTLTPTPTPDPDPEPTPTSVNNYSTSYNSQYLTASSGNDSIYNNYSNVKISAGSGNDTINNGTLGDYSSLSGGAGNDSINAGYTYGVTLNGGSGNDTLTGSTSSYSGDVFQFGNYDGNDVITNYGTNDTIHLTGIYSASNITSSISGSNKIISAGSTKITLQGAANKNVKVKLANGSMTTIGNDTTNNNADDNNNNNNNADVRVIGGHTYYFTNALTGTNNDDWIENFASNATISGADGDDIIRNFGNYVSLSGGNGDDSIVAGTSTVMTRGVTLNGGKGDDTLTGSDSYLYGDVFQFGNYDGNNVITNYGTRDTIHLTDIYDESSVDISDRGSDKIIHAGSTYITLKGAASKNVNIKNAYGADITPILIEDEPEITINGNIDTSSVSNYYDKAFVSGTDENNFIYNKGSYATVNAGLGNDKIENYGDYSSLVGGSGNDSINAGIYTYGVTLNGGAGNDTLIGSTSYNSGDVFQFGNYDGNNVITNYGTNDTLNFTGTYSSGSVYSSKSGSDRIITVGSTKITLQGAANKNIKVKLAGGSMTTLYASSYSYYEERNSIEKHWFTSDDNNVVDSHSDSASQLDLILNSSKDNYSLSDNLKISTNDYSVNVFSSSNLLDTTLNTLTYAQPKKK